MNFTEMSDEEVLQLRTEVNSEADRRLAAMTLRNDTKDLALKAKDLGRSKEEVGYIVGSVVDEVYAEPQEPEPEPEQPVPEEG